MIDVVAPCILPTIQYPLPTLLAAEMPSTHLVSYVKMEIVQKLPNGKSSQPKSNSHPKKRTFKVGHEAYGILHTGGVKSLLS